MSIVTGLTTKQKVFCDVMWALDSREKVLAFIRSLPESDRKEAEVALELMILSFIDEIETCDEAKNLLSKF